MSVCPDLKRIEKEPQFQELCKWYPDKSHQWIADALITWRDFYPHHGPDAYPIKSAFTRFMNHTLEKARFATSSESGSQTKDVVLDAYSEIAKEYSSQQLEDRLSYMYINFMTKVNNYRKEHPGVSIGDAISDLGGVVRMLKSIFDGYNSLDAETIARQRYKLIDTDPDDIKERKRGAASYFDDELKRMYRHRNRLAMLFLAELKEREGIEAVYNGVELDIDKTVEELDKEKESKRQERIEKLKLEGLSDEEAEEREEGSTKGDRYVDFRTISFDDTVGIATRRLFFSVIKLDAEGKTIRDDMGMARRVSFRNAIPVLRDLLLDVEPKSMMTALRESVADYPWLNGLVTRLEKNPDEQVLIYNDCKRVQQNYISAGVQFDGKTQHDNMLNSAAAGKSLAKKMASNISTGNVTEPDINIVDGAGFVRVNHKLYDDYKFQDERDAAPDTPGVDKFSHKNVHFIDNIFKFTHSLRLAFAYFDTSIEGSADWGDLVNERTVLGYAAKRILIPWKSNAAGRKGLESVIDQLSNELEIFARICRGIGLEITAEDLRTAALTPISQKSARDFNFANNRMLVIIDQVESVIERASSLTRDYGAHADDGFRKIEPRRLLSDIDNEMNMLDRALNITQFDNVEPDATIGNKRYSTYIPINLLHETFDRVGRILRKKNTEYTQDEINYLRNYVDSYKQCEGYTVNGEPIGFIKYIDNIVRIVDLRASRRTSDDTDSINREIDSLLDWNNRFTTNDRDAFKLLDNLTYNDVEYADMTDAQHQTLSLRRFLNQNAIEVNIQSDYEVSEYLQMPLPVGHDNWVDAFTDEVLAESERISRLMKFNSEVGDDKSRRVQPVYEDQGTMFHVFPEMNNDEVLDELAKYADDPTKLRVVLRDRVEKLLAEYYVKGMKRLVGDDNFVLSNPNFEKGLYAKIPGAFNCDENGVYRRELLDKDGKNVKDADGNNVVVEDTSRIRFKDEDGNWHCYREFKPGEGGERNHYMWNFIIGTMYGHIQMEKMTMGGRSFFQSILDEEKRSMMTHGPRNAMYTEGTWHGKPLKTSDGVEVTEEQKTNEHVLYIKDENAESAVKDAIREHLLQQAKLGMMSENQANDYADSYSVKATDGIGFRSPESYRMIKIWNAEWTDEDEIAFQKMMKGTATSKDLARFRPHFKPLYSGYEIVEYPDGTKLRVPVLHKYSEMMILPSSMMDKGGFQMKASPLYGIAKAMEEKGVDLVLFGSGVKVGASYMINDLFDVVDDGNGNKVRKYDTGEKIAERISSAIDAEPRSVHRLPWSRFGKTASLPPHILNTSIAWSAQAYKLARANISARDIVSVNGMTMNAKTGQRLFDQVEASIIAFEYERLMNELNDPSKVVELLQRELAQKSYSSPEMAWALNQLKDGKMSLPLFYLTVSNSAQQLITSIFRSRLTRHKTKGANYVQTSSLGLDEVKTQFNDSVRKLRVVYNDDEVKSGKEKKKRIKHIEAYAALHDDRLLEFADENGFLGPEQIQMLLDEGILDPRVLECIGYRTPSDAEHSVIPIRIVGFIVNASGADIILPREVMNMTGHDYDGDKLRVHFHDFEIEWDEDKIRREYDRRVAASDESVTTPKGVMSFEAFRGMVMNKNNPNRYKYRKTVVYSLDYNELVSGDNIVKNPADMEFKDYRSRMKSYDNAMVDLVFAQLTSPEGSARMSIPGGAGDSSKIAKIHELLRLLHGQNKDTVRKGLAEFFSGKFGRRMTSADMQSTPAYQMLKSLSTDEVQALLNKFSSNDSHYSYNHVMDAFEYMMKGANMVSGFALYNSAFALLQKMDIHFVPRTYKRKRKDGSVYKQGKFEVTILGNRIDKLFDPQTNDGSMYAILTLAHLLNAAVDNGKDPLMGYLGQSNSLIPLTFFLAAAGFNEEQIHLIINQPVVQEIKRIMDENKTGLGNAIRQVREEFEEGRKIHSESEDEKSTQEADNTNDLGSNKTESTEATDAQDPSSEDDSDIDEEQEEYDEFFEATADGMVEMMERRPRSKKNGRKGKRLEDRLQSLAIASEDIFTDMLGIPFEDFVSGKMNSNVVEFQQNLLGALGQISGAVNELSKAVSTMRAESSTGSVGPNIPATQSKLAKFEKIMDTPFSRVSGLDAVFAGIGVENGDSAQTIMKKLGDSPEPVTTLLYELSMNKCLDFMSRYFPQAQRSWYDRALSLAEEYDYPEVKDILLKSIQEEMILYKLMSNPKYAGATAEEIEDKRKDLVLEFPYRFNEFRNKCLDAVSAKARGDEYDEGYASLGDNLLIRKILLKVPWSSAKNTSRAFLNYDADSLIDTKTTENTQRAWNELVNSNLKEARQIATDLMDYSIFTNGYSFGRREFGHFAPFSVLMKTPHFSEALFSVLGSEFTDEEWERFKLYFYLNHAGEKERLVPSVPVGMLPKDIRQDFQSWYNKNVESGRKFKPAKRGTRNGLYIKSKRVIGVVVKTKGKPKTYYFEIIRNGDEFFMKPVQLCGDTNAGGRKHRQYNPYVDAYSVPALHEGDRDKYKNGPDAVDSEASKMKSASKVKEDKLDSIMLGGYAGIYESVDAMNDAKAAKAKDNFIESSSSNYAVRTKENAEWSDITIAFAVDFSTAGEKATRKYAGDKWMPVKLEYDGEFFGVDGNSQLDAIVNKAGDKSIKLNIAGNGIYTLSKLSSQGRVDDIVHDAISYLVSKGVKISEIRSGGQTGVDEAGTKAAIRLGIPWTVVAPKGFKMRTADGVDVSDREAFVSRFSDVKPDSPQAEQNVEPAAENQGTTQSRDSSTVQQNTSVAMDDYLTNFLLGGKMFALAEQVIDENGNESVRVNGVPVTPNSVREARRQRLYVNLNRRLRELLAKSGVAVGVIDEMYERMGVVGVTEFDKPVALANGLIEYIRLAHGFVGEMALPEEFSHMAVAMLRGNVLVERLRNMLANDENALRSAFNGQYEQYANDPSYRGNRDKLVEEAIGKLIQRQIVEQAEAEYHSVRSLVKRVAEAIKDFFRKMFSIRDIQDAMYDSLEISSKLARDLLSGKLIDQMDLANIETAGDFKSISKDLSEKKDILNTVVKNETKRLSIYMRRLGNDEKKIADSPAIAAIRDTISKLTDQIWADKTELALMGYMSDAIDRIVEAHKDLIEAVNAGLGANEEGKQLNLLRDLLFSYSNVSGAIRDAINDGEIVASDEFVELLNRLDGKISEYYSRYSKLSGDLFAKMLVNVYGEHGVDVTLRGKTRHISIEEMRTHGDHDINLAQRWFYSIANCDDFVLKAIDDVTRKAKFRARGRTAEAQRKVDVAMSDYVRETGSRDTSFIYQRDENGHKTGKYITNEQIDALPDAQKKIARFLISLKTEADKFVPESVVTAYGGTSSIVMMRKSTMEKVRTSGGISAGAGEIWDSFKNSILEESDGYDPETERMIVDFENSPVDKLPVHFLTKSKSESFDDMTDDAATAILAYVGMANEYDELDNVIGILENARYASMERDVDQGTRRRKQREIIEADDTGYRRIFTVKQARTNIQKIMDDFYRMHLYGHLHHDEGTWKIFGKEVSKSKVASKIGAVTTYSQMAFNFQQRISNIATGKMQIIIEAGNGKFSIGDIVKADALYLKYTPDRLLDTGKTESDNKLSLWREKFDVGQNNGDLKSKGYGKKRTSRLFNTNIMFAGLLAGEDYMSTITSLALSENFKLKDSDNNEYSLFDAYDVVYSDPVNKTGAYLKLKSGLTKLDGTPLTEDDEYRFMKQVAGTNFDLQGIYNLDDRCAAQSRALGSLAIMYRKWIAPAIKRRYGGAQYDILREGYVEGFYRTVWNNLHPEAIMRIFQEGESFRLGMLLNWDNLTAMEKSNCKKALIEMGSICGILLALMMLDKLPEDDDDGFLVWTEKMGYYQLLRLKNELGSMAPTPMLLAEAKKILESPFAAYKPLAATFDAWNLFLPSNYMTTVRSGPYKGHTRAYKYFWSLPILSMRKQFRNIADPTNLINFYKNPQ